MINLNIRSIHSDLLLIAGLIWIFFQIPAYAADLVTPPGSNWRTESDARIQQYRTNDFELLCVDESGKVLKNTNLSINQIRSDFHFGMAVTSQIPNGVDGEKYLEFISHNFNMVVAENAMKWYAIERQKDQRIYDPADFILRFAVENNMSIRGHCLFWAKPRYNMRWMQDLSSVELKQEMETHLEDVMNRYKGKLMAWDVNNEMLDGAFFQEQLGDDIRAWMFKRAAELDPSVPLFVNEYGIVDSDEKTERYFQLIQELQENGASVGGIGIQDHSVENFIPYLQGKEGRTPQDVWKRLDRLSELNLPIHFTEISCVTDDIPTRADALEVLFRVGYAHPNVEAVLLWGFWANRLWKGENACLVEADWTVNEAGERIIELLNHTWRTNTEIQTNENGIASFHGFYGTYEFQAAIADGNFVKMQVEFTKDNLFAKAVIPLNED